MLLFLLITSATLGEGQRCDNSCLQFASEWIGDGSCDRDRCAACAAYTKNGVFDGGDCGTAVGAQGQRCDNSCLKFASEWIGDGVCDQDKCAACAAYTKNGVFDGGDCGTAVGAQGQ